MPIYNLTMKNFSASIISFSQDYQLMKEVEGVDICLSGHTHNWMETNVKTVQAMGTFLQEKGGYQSNLKDTFTLI